MVQAALVTLLGILPLSIGIALWMNTFLKATDSGLGQNQAICIAFGIPLLVCLCALLALFEQGNEERRLKQKMNDRVCYLNMLSQAVASQLRRNKSPSEVRRFIDRDLHNRDEKLYVLYTGWRESQNQPVDDIQLRHFQQKPYATQG
jgi:hypothetical protein